MPSPNFHTNSYILATVHRTNPYAWIFENRVSNNNDSFYYLAIKNNTIRPKAEEKPISDAGQYVNGP